LWKGESGNEQFGIWPGSTCGGVGDAPGSRIQREELLNDELRFVNEVSRRQEMEAELFEIRRGLQLLGFPTAAAGDRGS
jgi:hypothetical protein